MSGSVDSLDWSLILDRSRQAGVARFVYAALHLAHDIFGAPLPPAAAWSGLAAATPARFRQWLVEQGPADVLTADYRRKDHGQDYRLTFLAARSAREWLGIVRFALLPPAGQLAVKYQLAHHWLAPLYYPRHLAERLGRYGRGLWGS
jgi:hypothetical protein